jgi:hypothetical protein
LLKLLRIIPPKTSFPFSRARFVTHGDDDGGVRAWSMAITLSLWVASDVLGMTLNCIHFWH